MASFWTGTDATGREVRLSARPERIVSLVPSQTEMLVDFGLGGRLVGRTRYCIHPGDGLSQVPAVGGTKKVDLAQVSALRPDLILAEKEENPREMVEALAKIAPAYVTDVVSVESALAMLTEVGALVGADAEAAVWRARIERELAGVRGIANGERALYLIWKKPWMAAGRGTFISSCLEHLGFANAVGDRDRYPVIGDEVFGSLAADRILLSSEPFPFREEDVAPVVALAPSARVERVDGEMFSWYGTRMARMPAYWGAWLSGGSGG